MTDIRNDYRACLGHAQGRRVLADLYRWISLNRLDFVHPDPNAALVRVAQIELMDRIESMLGKEPEHDD